VSLPQSKLAARKLLATVQKAGPELTPGRTRRRRLAFTSPRSFSCVWAFGVHNHRRRVALARLEELQRKIAVRNMNTGPKHELKFDIPGFLLALAVFAYEQVDRPHGKAVGLTVFVVWLLLLARIVQNLTRTNLTFKDSSEFTWWRRQVIVHDIEGMHNYFARLEIPVPDSIPPLVVQEEGQPDCYPSQG
jgi:hypothetical protein